MKYIVEVLCECQKRIVFKTYDWPDHVQEEETVSIGTGSMYPVTSKKHYFEAAAPFKKGDVVLTIYDVPVFEFDRLIENNGWSSHPYLE